MSQSQKFTNIKNILGQMKDYLNESDDSSCQSSGEKCCSTGSSDAKYSAVYCTESCETKNDTNCEHNDEHHDEHHDEHDDYVCNDSNCNDCENQPNSVGTDLNNLTQKLDCSLGNLKCLVESKQNQLNCFEMLNSSLDKLNECNDRTEYLKKSLDKSSCVLSQFSETICQLEKKKEELMEEQKECQEFNSAVESVNCALDGLQCIVEQLTCLIDKTRDELTTCVEQHKQVQCELNKVEELLNGNDMDIQDLICKIQEEEQKQCCLQDKLEEMCNAASQAQEAIAQLNEEIAELQTQKC